MTDLRPGAFLDRDGTVIRDADYLADPARIEILPGAAEAIRALNDAGLPVAVITNQSGIARGLLTERDYEQVRARLDSLLAERGARIDLTVHCPHHPDFTGPCTCRKPLPGMFLQAAHALNVDPSRSLFVGDRWRDLDAGLGMGGTGFLIVGEATGASDRERAAGRAVPSLAEAVARFLAVAPRNG